MKCPYCDNEVPGNTANCPSCGAACLPHRVCKACGMYDGKQVIQVKKNDED